LTRNFQGETGRNLLRVGDFYLFFMNKSLERHIYYKDFCEKDFIRKSLRNAFVRCSFKGCEKKAHIIYGFTTWYCVYHALIVGKVRGFVESLGGQK
jgi:hypothetical protein